MAERGGLNLSVSDKAAELHHAMVTTESAGHHFKQVEMQDLIQAKSQNELMRYVQELLNSVSILPKILWYQLT